MAAAVAINILNSNAPFCQSEQNSFHWFQGTRADWHQQGTVHYNFKHECMCQILKVQLSKMTDMDCVAQRKLATFPGSKGILPFQGTGPLMFSCRSHCYCKSRHLSCWLAEWHLRIKSSRWHNKSLQKQTKKLFYFYLKLIRFSETIAKWSIVQPWAGTSFLDIVLWGSAAVGVTSAAHTRHCTSRTPDKGIVLRIVCN